MKICADCKHAKSEEFGLLRCNRPGYTRMDKVEGEPDYCSVQRLFSWPVTWMFNTCGESARFFEKR